MHFFSFFARWIQGLKSRRGQRPLLDGALVQDEESPVDLAATETSSSMRLIDEASDSADFDGWHKVSVAEWQDTAYHDLLVDMYAGDVRLDLKVAADAVRDTGLSRPQLLEVGCGSGYYNEVLGHLLGDGLDYTGLDYSKAMIALASKKYPGAKFVVGDATEMEFADGAYDIVFNGASLMHMPDYEKAIAESRRVAGSWCIFHTVPLLHARSTTLLTKKAYGGDVIEVVLNRASFERMLEENGLSVFRVHSSIAHGYLDELVGEPVTAFTYVCKKQSSL